MSPFFCVLMGDVMKFRNLVKLALCLGLFQVAAYYFAGAMAGVNGGIACPQPDTLLYCQAARRIVEGHPFSFSIGSSVCSGTTTIIYPFILAIPYALGCTGGALLVAGFFLNSVFYLIGLLSWTVAVHKWARDYASCVVAVLLIALSGAYANAALAQSDIGLWLAVSGLLAAGLATNRRWLYAAVLIVGPWVRPEGMVCNVAFSLALLMVVALRKIWPGVMRDKFNGATWSVMVFAMLSTAGVFAFNYLLTGQMQFASVANKGYAVLYPFPESAYRMFIDLCAIFRDVFLGLSNEVPRCFYAIPLLGGLAFWTGALTHNWRDDGVWRMGVFLLAVLGGIITVAQSGWQGTNLDRYLCWILPMFLFFVAEGVVELGRRIRSVLPRMALAGLFVMYALATSMAMVMVFNLTGSITDSARAFAWDCDRIMPDGATVGAVCECGIMYEMKSRKMVHVSGIYSPEISGKCYPARLEELKREPEKRFDYWLCSPSDNQAFGEEVAKNLGDSVLTGPNGFTLLKANWDVFAPKEPRIAGQVLKARVDVGYDKDEKAALYHPIMRYGLADFKSVLCVDDLNGKKHLEALRVLFGGDEMTVALETNKPVTVVLRTYPKQKVSYGNCTANFACDYAFANPLRLQVSVDGRDAGVAEVKYAEKGFSDVVFTIPGAAITQSPCRIAFLGDHIACGYWFLQAEK